MRISFIAILLACTVHVAPALALDAGLVERVAFGTGDERVEAVTTLAASGDAQALALLTALAKGEVQTAGNRVLIVRNDSALDAVTGQTLAPLPAGREDLVVNNRLRSAIAAALAGLRLLAPEREVRLAAVKELSRGLDPAMLPLVQKALEQEQDPAIRPMLEIVTATLQLASSERATRLSAIRMLGRSADPSVKTALLPLTEQRADGSFGEPDIELRTQAQTSLRAVESRLVWGERAGLLFAGVSLGSILLLAALGLAITYGLMGVINMAHGELIMIGAYTTYVVQNLFREHLPGAFGWYVLCALPAAFAVSAAVGMLIERSVVRYLYGRPLETLLATWGISLILMQTVRTVFGAQNVQVENPAWLSGGIQVLANVVLPWSRIAIIVFAAAVLVGMWLVLTRTRLGLFVRGVTQNRAMASCVGVPTARVDTLAFGLGSGIAGLAGCALSQIGNVGPDLGQAYIVDSFMVVVLGGVGQLAGTIYAALGLGFANKLLEAWSGAVLAKIAVLVFIILFIQKRPQGLFALKGRAVEA